MSASNYQHHANEGGYAFNAGRFLESADHYWQAFASMPRTSDYRYHILHGCTAILRDNHFKCTDEDISNIRTLFQDKSEAHLFRLEATFILAIMHYARQERSKCEEVYHHAISIGEKNLKDKDAKKEERFQHISKGEKMEKKSMKELTEGLLNYRKQNLKQLNSPRPHHMM
jgi:tetratricopeptide (TPR) repeat protein